MAPGTPSLGHLLSIHRYPVKSMLGEELNASAVGTKGLHGDRQFALSDPATGKVASAKNPAKWPGLFNFRAAYQGAVNGGPFPPVRITFPDGSDWVSGDPQLDDALSVAVGRAVRLLGAAPPRGTLEEYWPDVEGLSRRDEVTEEAMPAETFFDCAAVHLLTTATLAELRRLYPEGQIETRRFRPNLVIGTPPEISGFAEGGWTDQIVLIGEQVKLKVTGPCSRCVMTTLAQGDLPRDTGVLRTAAKHNQAQVGAYASVLQGGTVRRGDQVKLVPA
jgi:MOSC domain-containing protein